MSTRGKHMTPLMPQAVRLLTVWLAVALLGPQPCARAQDAPGGSPAPCAPFSPIIVTALRPYGYEIGAAEQAI